MNSAILDDSRLLPELAQRTLRADVTGLFALCVTGNGL